MRKLAIFTGCALLIAGIQVPTAIASAASETTAPPSPATEAHTQGQERLARRTADDIQAAIEDFERALEADATFAPAYAGLAEAKALVYDYPGARQAALRALELDERLAAAHAVLGFSLLHGDWDWAGAEKELRRAVELDPRKPTPHLWYAIVLEATGRSEEAVTELTAAAQLDPQLETAHYFIARAHVQQGRFKEAHTAFDRAREISPRDSNLTSAEAYMDALSGKRKQAQKALGELERHASRGLKFSSQVAGLHAALGNKVKALGWLERAQENHEGALVWIKIDPRFDPLRGEPRFKAILREMKLDSASTNAPSP